MTEESARELKEWLERIHAIAERDAIDVLDDHAKTGLLIIRMAAARCLWLIQT